MTDPVSPDVVADECAGCAAVRMPPDCWPVCEYGASCPHEWTDPVSPDVAAALDVILARVRCEAIHGQTDNGRCVSCILWAKQIGTPRHLPRLAAALTPDTETMWTCPDCEGEFTARDIRPAERSTGWIPVGPEPEDHGALDGAALTPDTERSPACADGCRRLAVDRLIAESGPVLDRLGYGDDAARFRAALAALTPDTEPGP
jgi:hypothetical protein